MYSSSFFLRKRMKERRRIQERESQRKCTLHPYIPTWSGPIDSSGDISHTIVFLHKEDHTNKKGWKNE
jgi:hypothetical protein